MSAINHNHRFQSKQYSSILLICYNMLLYTYVVQGAIVLFVS